MLIPMEAAGSAFSQSTELLERIYSKTVYPVEHQFYFVLGGSHVGKTKFIQKFIGEEYPLEFSNGSDEDERNFTVIHHGTNDEISTPPEIQEDVYLPFNDLGKLGKKLSSSNVTGSRNTSPVLKALSFVHSPDIFADDRKNAQVDTAISYFAKKATKVFLFLDINTVDLTTGKDFNSRFKAVFTRLGGFQQKLTIVFSNCDPTTHNFLNLVRTKVAELYFYLGGLTRTFTSFDAISVLTLSLDETLEYETVEESMNPTLLRQDFKQLMRLFKEIPKLSLISKRDILANRMKMVKIHGIVLSFLRTRIKSKKFFAKQQKQQKAALVDRLEPFFKEISKTYKIKQAHMPKLAKFREKFLVFPLDNFFELECISETQQKAFKKVLSNVLNLMEDLFDQMQGGEGVDLDFSLNEDDQTYKSPFHDSIDDSNSVGSESMFRAKSVATSKNGRSMTLSKTLGRATRSMTKSKLWKTPSVHSSGADLF